LFGDKFPFINKLKSINKFRVKETPVKERGFFKITIFRTAVFYFFILFHPTIFSDWQHYNDFLIGDRAAGMGGAYTAISNDPSGIFYNPGGLAFTGDSEISLSTMGYYSNTQQVSSILGVSDFQLKQNDSDVINGFFGGVSKFKLFSKDFYISFGIFVPDNSNIDSKIRLASSNNGVVYAGDQRITDYESYYNLAVSTKIFPDLGIGLVVGFFDIEHDELITKNITYGPFVNSNGSYVYAVNTNISDLSFSLKGIHLDFGALYKITKELSLGLSVVYNIPVWQKLTSSSLDSAIVVDANFKPVQGSVTLTDGTIFTQHVNNYTSNSYNTPFPTLPIQSRIGLAWQPVDFQLLSFDVSYYSGISSAVSNYNLNPIFNYALGSETKFFDVINFRLGAFTNNWAGSSNQQEQVINSNFIGLSSGIAYQRDKKTSYGLTFIYQQTYNALYVPNTSISKSNYPGVDWSTYIVSLGMSSDL
jgi:hypothetical protein